MATHSSVLAWRIPVDRGAWWATIPGVAKSTHWECVHFDLFSRSVVSSSLQPRGLQHTRLPCSSLSPGACSNSCPLSWWCHPTISSSVIPFSSCLQPFPALGYFPMSGLFASGGQNNGASASASVLPMNIQDWFPLELTGCISLQSTVKSLLQHGNSKASILWHSAFFFLNINLFILIGG